jgi:hypothetical protein
MKHIFILIAIFCMTSLALNAQNLKIEEILDKYYKANGFDKLQNIKTIIMTGTITRNDLMPMKIIRMRPDKYKMEFDVADITCLQVFDGQVGWFTAPYTGNAKPQKMTEDATKDMKIKADFDGVLYNWKEKGHNVELIGQDTIENSTVYKIKITRKDGSKEFNFIDTKNFLMKKRITYRMAKGKEIEVENIFSDYRSVEGIMFAFINNNKMGGQPYSYIQFESVELNKPVDAKIFEMPTK